MKNYFTFKNNKTEEVKTIFMDYTEIKDYLKKNKGWEQVKNFNILKEHTDWAETKVFRGTEEELFVYLKEHPDWYKRIPPPIVTACIGDFNWREKLKRSQPEFANIMKNKIAPLAPEGSELRQKWG